MSETMQNAVERWLTHGSYKFKQVQMDGSFFCSVIRHLGGFGNPVHVFEPVDQPGVIIVGSKVPLKSMQNFRYLKFNEYEQKKIQDKIANFCNSIRAVHKIHTEDGKVLIGAYIVLDKKDQINGDSFLGAVKDAAEMGDKVSQFLAKAI